MLQQLRSKNEHVLNFIIFIYQAVGYNMYTREDNYNDAAVDDTHTGWPKK